MKFKGLREYQTSDPAALRQDLQRQNAAVDEALSALERERAARPVPRSVVADTTAVHDEMLLVSVSCRIELPRSDASTPGRAVTVVLTKSGLSVTVAAAGGEFVMTFASELFSSIPGLRRYEDDGLGNWWRAV